MQGMHILLFAGASMPSSPSMAALQTAGREPLRISIPETCQVLLRELEAIFGWSMVVRATASLHLPSRSDQDSVKTAAGSQAQHIDQPGMQAHPACRMLTCQTEQNMPELQGAGTPGTAVRDAVQVVHLCCPFPAWGHTRPTLLADCTSAGERGAQAGGASRRRSLVDGSWLALGRRLDSKGRRQAAKGHRLYLPGRAGHACSGGVEARLHQEGGNICFGCAASGRLHQVGRHPPH